MDEKCVSSPFTMLHTANTTINGIDLKMIINPGSDSSVATRHCVDKLQLSPTNSSKLLNVKTLTGSKQIASSKVKIPI